MHPSLREVTRSIPEQVFNGLFGLITTTKRQTDA